MNSRAKGARGEREAAAFLSVNGFPARRGCQFAGSPDSPDVLCQALERIHFEVKRTERTDIYGWLTQAQADADDRLPVVLHRKNGGKWVAILDATEFLRLVRDGLQGTTASKSEDESLPRVGREQEPAEPADAGAAREEETNSETTTRTEDPT